MKKLATLFTLCLISFAGYAQDFKFGHINVEEIVYLMPETDTALRRLEVMQVDLQESFTAMQAEFQSKYDKYQKEASNWLPAKIEAEEKGLQDLQQRIQAFQNQAPQDLQQEQNKLMAPIYKAVGDAIKKVSKENHFTYIFDLGTAGIVYFDEVQSQDISTLVKQSLNIPLDKKLPTQQAQQQQAR